MDPMMESVRACMTVLGSALAMHQKVPMAHARFLRQYLLQVGSRNLIFEGVPSTDWMCEFQGLL